MHLYLTWARARRASCGFGRGRVLVLALALALSTSAGAVTTIKTSVYNDPLLCKQFFGMVKAAGIPEMSDAQLCDFRFARLPPSIAKRFTAIDWKPLKVKDPVAMYRSMRMANLSRPAGRAGPPWPHLMKAAAEAAADHNLGFYTAKVKLQGKGLDVTVVKMDIVRGCSKLPPSLKTMGIPYYAIYKGATLKHPLRFWIPLESSEMVFWNGKGINMPVLLTVFPYWGPPIAGATDTYFNEVTASTLVPDNVKSGPFRDTVSDYGVCQEDMRASTKPAGTSVYTEESQP